MNNIRIRVFALGAFFALCGGVHAQKAVQSLSFSLLGEYQTNTFYTSGVAVSNSSGADSEYSFIRPVAISTGNIVRALAIDLEGTNYTKWNGARLYRETDLSSGAEVVIMTKGTNKVDVSSFFGGSISSNFMGQLGTAFPGFANNITGGPNVLNSGSSSIPQTFLVHGWVHGLTTTPSTNYTSTAGLYYVSFNTANIKFNVVAMGDGRVTQLSSGGNKYQIPSEFPGVAGAFYLNVSTNLTAQPGIGPWFATGPVHGSFSCGAPTLSNEPFP